MKKVSYLGIPGSFSFTAAQKYFGEKILMQQTNSLREVFEDVAKARSDFGVVPLENSTAGSIVETFDLLMDSRLSIAGEIILRIHQHLLANAAQTNIKNIKCCFSHPQAISQSESFFLKHRWIKPQFTSDTATAAQSVAKQNRLQEAAIASQTAAKIYGLVILQRNIEDNPNNFTRFAVLSRKANKTGNKISLALSVEHVAGSLFKTLKPYTEHNLNLTKIESRPVFGKTWEYVFFLDFLIGETQEDDLTRTLVEMKETCRFISVLGRYPKGEVYET